jgi:hypothetical protein
MQITALKENQAILKDTRLNKAYDRFKALIKELNDKELPTEIIESINQYIDALNISNLENGDFRKLLRKNQAKILKLIRDKLKIVTKNYYRDLWLAIGMTAFGLPIGAAISLGTSNRGMLAAGLPIGMAIGLAIGTAMDQQALKQGKQLNIELTC